MKRKRAKWYLPGSDDQPDGPFDSPEVVEAWIRGRISDKTLCWREGMPDWKPVGNIPRLVSLWKQLRKRRRQRYIRRLGLALITAAISGGGAFFFLKWHTPPPIRDAEMLIATRRYIDAGWRLAPYLAKHTGNAHACYLMGVAALGDYASSANTRPTKNFGLALVRTDQRLDAAKKYLRVAFLTDVRWRNRALTDLPPLFDSIPAKTPDFLTRMTEMAEFFSDFNIVPRKELASMLIAAIERAGVVLNGSLSSRRCVQIVLRSDPNMADRLIAIASRHEATGPSNKYAPPVPVILEQWARDAADLREPLRNGLIRFAAQAAKERRFDDVDEAFSAAVRIDPDARATIAAEWLKTIKTQLMFGQYRNVVDRLNRLIAETRSEKQETAVFFEKHVAELVRLDPDCEKKLRPELRSAVLEVRRHQQYASTWKIVLGLVEADQYDRALEKLDEILRDDPSNAKAKAVRSEILSRKKQFLAYQRLYEQARKLMIHTHHVQAAEFARQALAMGMDDQAAQKLLDEIEKRKKDPATAELTGLWRLPDGEDVLVQGDDKVLRITAPRLSSQLRSWHGQWTRDGTKLAGVFEIVFAATPRVTRAIEVCATVVSPTELEVQWEKVRWADHRRIKGTGYGAIKWEKVAVR
ncbi:MAG: DUF4339 domain-containing protein [Kiritimatiellaeota bacterium]|nr:DUF4339 domain-containing protein [Kiritimatiellota bacterium]